MTDRAQILRELEAAVREATGKEAMVMRAELATLDSILVLRIMEASKGLLSADQAAGQLGLSSATVRRMAGRGEIGCVRAGDAIRFRHEHLEEWISRNERKAHDPLAEYSPKRRRAG